MQRSIRESENHKSMMPFVQNVINIQVEGIPDQAMCDVSRERARRLPRAWALMPICILLVDTARPDHKPTSHNAPLRPGARLHLITAMRLRILALPCFLSAGSVLHATDPSPDLVKFAPPWSSVFRVDPEHRYHLANAEGRHLYLFDRTTWLYFRCEDPTGVLRRTKAIGANVLRVALAGAPYFDAKHLLLWPWEGTPEHPDYAHFSASYWDEVERRVRLAGEQGIGLDLVLYYYTLKPTATDIDAQRPYWDEAIRRLSKYANILTWEIANEYTGNETFQDAVAAYLHTHDPWHRPVCTSDITTDNAVWPLKPWMDLAIVHTCTSSAPRDDLQDWYLALAHNVRSWAKPAFANETGREIRHQNDDGVNRRKQAWLWGAAGAYWEWHSWGGCEGIDDPNYHAPGEEFMPAFAGFFSNLPFWEMAPNDIVVQILSPGVIKSVLSKPDDTDTLAYFCVRETGRQADEVRIALRVREGHYRLDYVEPATGRVMSSQFHESRGGAVVLMLPAFRDDLALHIVKLSAKPLIEPRHDRAP